MKLPKNFKTKGIQLYEFQIESLIFALKRNNAGLLLPMGSGKTLTSLNIARYRIQNNKVKRVLIVCPPSIFNSWEKEIKKVTEYKSIILYHQNKKERTKKLKQTNFTLYIINYEALNIYLKELIKLKFDMIIFDESARYLKNPFSLRTLAATYLADRAKYKLILTGTPISNYPLDIWSQFRALDGGGTFGDNYYKYRGHFFKKIKIGKFNKYIINKYRIDSLRNSIYRSCIRFKKKDILPQLPEKIFNIIEINMEDSLKKIYNTVQKKVLSEIDTLSGKTILEVNNILTKLQKLQQVTSGFIINKGKTNYLKYTPKLDALVEHSELILSAGESVIIWCRFLDSIDLISKRLGAVGIKSICMSGKYKDSPEERNKKWRNFQKSKTINVFIGQIRSGGIGIELFKEESKAKFQHMIFYESTWAMDDRFQALDRIHRIGQNSTCVYTDILIKETIDERIYNNVINNKKIADLILDGGVQKFLKGK